MIVNSYVRKKIWYVNMDIDMNLTADRKELARGKVRSMLRVWVCGTHMGGLCTQNSLNKGSFLADFPLM